MNKKLEMVWFNLFNYWNLVICHHLFMLEGYNISRMILENRNILNIKGFYFYVWSPCWSNKSDRNVCKNSHCLLMQIALTNRSLPVVSRPTSAFWGSHNCPYITRVDPEPRTHPAWRLLYCLKKKINLRHQKYIKQYARHVVIIFQSVKRGFYDLMSKWPK